MPLYPPASSGGAGVTFGFPTGNGNEIASIPGAVILSSGTLRTLNADERNFAPMYVDAPATLVGLEVSVTSTPGASSARVTIWTANEDWQPVAIVYDSPEFDTSTTGKKAVTGLSVSLEPNRYLLSIIANAGVTFHTCGLSVPGTYAQRRALITQFFAIWKNSEAYGPAGTPIPWSGSNASTSVTGLWNFVFPHLNHP